MLPRYIIHIRVIQIPYTFDDVILMIDIAIRICIIFVEYVCGDDGDGGECYNTFKN